MGMTKWDPVVIHDVITGLTTAANNVDGELNGVKSDIESTLDFPNWHDDARPIYDDQQQIWTDAARGMHAVLHEGAIPTLGNMHENLSATETQNKMTWNSVYD